MLVGIIVSIIMFSLIVLVHEFGHFKAARLFGVKVYEFGLGIPPKAKKLFEDKKGTIYTLNWLPIGGFVRLKGESINYFLVYDENKKIYNPDELVKILDGNKKVYDKKGQLIGNDDKKNILKQLKENQDDDNLINKSYFKQSVVILAGVFMNFVLSFFIFFILFLIGVKPIGINDKLSTDLDIKMFPTFEQAIEKGILSKENGVNLYPLTGSVAYTSGIRNEDLLLKVNSIEVDNPDDVKNIISSNIGTTLKFSIKRNNNLIEIDVIPSHDGKIGSYLSPNINYNKEFEYKYSFGNAIIESSKEVYNVSLLTFKALGTLVRKVVIPNSDQERDEAIQSVSGPVGIVAIVNDSIKGGIVLLFVLASLISINLGVFNLLPIPALDGGRFVFISINKLIKTLTGRKGVSPYAEGLIHMFFFAFLIFLSIIITYNDILKL